MNAHAVDKNRLDMISIVLVLDRLVPAGLVKLNRAARLQSLRNHSHERRQDLVRWIEGQGLSGEVSRISGSTAFNMLFVRCTPELAAQLDQAPGVVNVFVDDDILVDLLNSGPRAG